MFAADWELPRTEGPSPPALLLAKLQGTTASGNCRQPVPVVFCFLCVFVFLGLLEQACDGNCWRPAF